MQRLWFRVVTGLLIAVMMVGCGGGAKKREDKKQVITQKGSDTMILLAQKWAETFGAKNPNIQVQVTGGGSGTGISSLINGTTDIANASRRMKDEERAQVKQKFGADVVEIPVAKDGIAIYVHESNALDSISIDQLRKIYAGQVSNWKELGGPDQKIILYGRENSSGTYEFFKEHVLNKGDFAATTQTLPGTAAVVNSIAQDRNGIGYGGEAFTQGVKQVKLVNDQGVAVSPTEENVLSGAYPLSRDLFFYLRQAPAGAIKEYIDYVLGPDGQAVVKEAGYYPLKK